MNSPNVPLRVRVGGPVGVGESTLTAALCRRMREQALPLDRICAVETGGRPHIAIREDASINLAAVAQLRADFPDLEVIFIASGGDNRPGHRQP